MVCANCGLDNDPSASFCARCNSVLGTALPAQPLPPPPPAPVRPRPAVAGRPVLVVAAVLVAVALTVTGAVLARRAFTGQDTAAPPATTPAATVTTTPPPTTAPPTTPATTPAADPRQQASVVDDLLERSGRSRAKLNRAIDRVLRCTGLDAALTDMREVGDERTTQLDELAAADLSALPGGESLRSGLREALRDSLTADEAYIDWAEPAARNGCADTAARDNAYSRGRSASDAAGRAKTAFLRSWNPVATSLGLPSRSRTEI